MALTCVSGLSAPPCEIAWVKDGVVVEEGSAEVTLYGEEEIPAVQRNSTLTLQVLLWRS